MAWSSPSFFGAGTMLVSAHDCAVYHRIFIIRIGSQNGEYRFPDTRFRPSAEPLMHVLPISKPIGKIAPRNTSPISVEHSLDKETIIVGCHPDTPPLVRAKGAQSDPISYWSSRRL
jgi:hypothetical protein